MRTWTVRLGLSLMVVVGLWTNRVPAQESVAPPQFYGVPPQPCVMPPPYLVVVPTVPFVPDYHPAYPPLHVPPSPPPSKCAVVRTLNHFGMACHADPWGTTGNFASEFHWAFSSSRQWFGDPCVPCTQPNPWR